MFGSGVEATASGLVLIAAGSGFALVAILQIGFETSTCVAGDLYTHGVYRYTHNPHTTGILVALAGAVLASWSAYLTVLAALDAVVLVAAVVGEEPWLSEQYGDEYDDYRESTPRFVGLPSNQ